MVRSAQTDLFVSIHVNAHRTKTMHGLETYHLDFARVSAAEQRRAVENALRGRSASARKKVSLQELFIVQKRETRCLDRTVQWAARNGSAVPTVNLDGANVLFPLSSFSRTSPDKKFL